MVRLRNTVRKVILYIVFTVTVFAVVAASYHFASPKVVLINLSDSPFDELAVVLPTSRVSFGPIAPHSSSTIYFSRQASGGPATYTVHSRGALIASGAVRYEESGQLFRVITITIQADGTISPIISG